MSRIRSVYSQNPLAAIKHPILGYVMGSNQSLFVVCAGLVPAAYLHSKQYPGLVYLGLVIIGLEFIPD